MDVLAALPTPSGLATGRLKHHCFLNFFEIDAESGHKRAIWPTLWHLLQITCPSVVRKLRPGDFCVLMLLVRTLAFWLGRNGAPSCLTGICWGDCYVL